MQPAQNTQQRDVRRRKRLPRGQHHDVEIGLLQGAPGDLVAHQERIVGAGRIDHRHRIIEGAPGQVEIRRLGDIRIATGSVTGKRNAGLIAGANILPQQILGQAGEGMHQAEQLAEFGAEAGRRLLLQAGHVLAQQFRFKPRHKLLCQLPEPAATLRQLMPLFRIEESKRRRVLMGVLRAQMQVRDRRRPRVDVGRQQLGHLHEGVDEGAFAGLDLADNGDPAHLVLDEPDRIVDEARSRRLQQSAQVAADLHQLAARSRQGFTNPHCAP